ncbi:hypothetical protein DVA85_18055 [Acinetobacter sp. RIT592]|nr:hypothetical protein DVA85_18055 [Acinetobacter sp. RIT592]
MREMISHGGVLMKEKIVNLDTLCTKKSTIKFYSTKRFCLEVDKINNLDDIKVILKAMQIVVGENYEHFDEIKHLLKESE